MLAGPVSAGWLFPRVRHSNYASPGMLLSYRSSEAPAVLTNTATNRLVHSPLSTPAPRLTTCC